MLIKLHFLVFFNSFSIISLVPTVNTLETSNDLMVLIISFISPIEINKVNPLPTLTAPFALIFISNLFIAFEDKFHTNPSKLSLAKGKETFVTAFLLKLASQEPKDPPDWIVLAI